MKSFHHLTEGQLDILPYTEGRLCPLYCGSDEEKSESYELFCSFLKKEKARSVTIGSWHPNPTEHRSNLGKEDFIYLTTDGQLRELPEAIVREIVTDKINNHLTVSIYQLSYPDVLKSESEWISEVVSSSLPGRRYSICHLMMKTDATDPLCCDPLYSRVSTPPLEPITDKIPVPTPMSRKLSSEFSDVTSVPTLPTPSLQELKLNKQDDVAEVSQPVSVVTCNHESEITSLKNIIETFQEEKDKLTKDIEELLINLQSRPNVTSAEYTALQENFGSMANKLSETEGSLEIANKDNERLQIEIAKLKTELSESKRSEEANLEKINLMVQEHTEEKDEMAGKQNEDLEKAKAEISSIKKVLNARNVARSRAASTKRSKSRKQFSVTPSISATSITATHQEQQNPTSSLSTPICPVCGDEDRITNETAFHVQRFEGKSAVLQKCLHMLYGTEDQYRRELAAEEKISNDYENEIRTLQDSGQQLFAKLREAENFEKVQDEEIAQLRSDLVATRADASLVSTELSTLKSMMSPSVSHFVTHPISTPFVPATPLPVNPRVKFGAGMFSPPPL